MNSRLKYFIVISVIVVFALAVLEIISSVVICKVYNRHFDSSLIVDNKYLTSPGLKENEGAEVWGKCLHTDEGGRRKNKTAFDAKKKKWLFIGDSVTEGVGVEDTATFSSLYADVLKEYNICNYSLVGYSSADYVNVLASVLQNDTATELVTLFYGLNDVYGTAATKDLPLMAKQNIFGKLNGSLQNTCATYKLIKLFFYQNSNRYFTYDLQFYKTGDKHFQAAMNDLHSCDSLCRAKNIYFNVVMLPYQSQLKDRNFAPQQLVKDFCEKDSIDFSDAAEYLSKQRDVKQLYLFADEIHLSSEGHQAVARFLSE